MSQAFISAADQAAWVGRSLVDNSVTESGDVIVLNTTTPVSVAGIEDFQSQSGETRRVVNRGTAAVTLAAEDTAAAVKDRFLRAAILYPSQSTMLFYNGTRWEPFTEV
jgi:hypothetical protein